MQALLLVGGSDPAAPPDLQYAQINGTGSEYTFLEHVIRYLGGHTVNDVVLAQGHLPKPMDDYFQDGSRFGIKLTYALETKPMGTAGAVKNAEQYLTDRFLVLNGDIFTDLDITGMLQFHLDRRAKVTIALTPVEDPTAYGLIETSSDGKVTRFTEKPSWDQVTTNMINAGTYIIDKEVLKRIPPQTNFSFERQLFPQLLDQGDPIYGYPSSAYWMDIGTPEKYLQLHRDLMRGAVKGYTLVQGKVVKIGQGCSIHPDTQIVGPVVIGNNCTIGRGVKLFGPVVLGSGNTIGEDSVIDSSITWQNNRFGTRVNLNECMVANDCFLDANTYAEKSVLGDHVTISRNTRLGPGSRIWPPVK